MVTESVHIWRRSCSPSIYPVQEITMMGPIVLSLLMLVVGCYSAPANLFVADGTLGFNNHFNGTIVGHLMTDQNGLYINGTGGTIIRVLWEPELLAKGVICIDNKFVDVDSSVKADIDSSLKHGFQAELGLNRKGPLLAKFEPFSAVKNEFLINPRFQLKIADARILDESLNGPEIENENGFTIKFPMNKACANVVPISPSAKRNILNPYAAYAYALSWVQSQVAQTLEVLSQMAQPQKAQSQAAQSQERQLAQSQVALSQEALTQVSQSQKTQSQVASAWVAQPQEPQSQVPQSEDVQSQQAQSQVAQSQEAKSQEAQSQVAKSQMAQSQEA